MSGSLKRNVYSDRFDGYQRALYKNGISFKKENLYESDLSIENVTKFIERIKSSKRKVDGIFVSNDTFAVRCILGLKKEGYRIPEDIKVIGFNNDPVSEVISPNLTTIEYPGYKMGILAGESIISHLSGSINIQSADQILIKHKLIKRESTRL
ncbi:LacI family DNA-binding transcriptional regulator [Zobellia nedashkovskayae]